MRRTLSLMTAVMVAAFLLPSVAGAQTLDEIIAMNLKAKGGIDKIRATSTVRMVRNL